MGPLRDGRSLRFCFSGGPFPHHRAPKHALNLHKNPSIRVSGGFGVPFSWAAAGFLFISKCEAGVNQFTQTAG
jgi:hypothetical protein